MSSNNDLGFGGNRSNNSMTGMNQGISERDLMGCEIRASLAGYRSDMISLSNHRTFDNPDLGTIVLHRLANVEGVTISSVSLNAPKDAKKAYDKGHDLLKKKKVAEAEKELEKAVGLYPQYATAWFDLGQARESQKDLEGARKAYYESLAADPKYLYPYRPLMAMYVKEQKWTEVADVSGKLVKLDPVDYPDALLQLGGELLSEGFRRGREEHTGGAETGHAKPHAEIEPVARRNPGGEAGLRRSGGADQEVSELPAGRTGRREREKTISGAGESRRR